jgi:hypothetical protein
MVIVFLWQFSGIIAALVAVQNQLLVSESRYRFLICGGIIWFFWAFILPTFFDMGLICSILFVCFAYLFLFVLYISDRYFGEGV